MMHPSHARRAESGVALIAVVFLVLLLGGLSLGLLEEGMAARTALQRHESNYLALEILEAGIAKAEVEILGLADSGSDGIGVVSGTYGGGTYEVSARQDTLSPDRWILTGKGTHLLSTRRVEVCVRRRARGTFVEGLFSKDSVSFDGLTLSDSYNSTLGPYASQTPGNRGDVGSNGSIELSGSSVAIHGNAIPGPLQSVELSGDPTVTGDMAPREFPIEIPDPSFASFTNAFLNNDNKSLSIGNPGPGGNGNYVGGGNGGPGQNPNGNGNGVGSGGKNYSYDPVTMALNVQGTLTLRTGTYFFSSVNMTAGSKLIIDGNVRVYSTGTVDLTGGSFLNGGTPGQFQLYVHPYPLPPGTTPSDVEVRLAGGSASVLACYAPAAVLDVGGGAEIYGAAVAKSIKLHGAADFHYDEALGTGMGYGRPTLERLYWRELTLPAR